MLPEEAHTGYALEWVRRYVRCLPNFTPP